MVMALSFSVTIASKPSPGLVDGLGAGPMPVSTVPHEEIRSPATAASSAVFTMNTQRARLAPGNNRPVATVNIGDSRAILLRAAPRSGRRAGAHCGDRLRRRQARRDPHTFFGAGAIGLVANARFLALTTGCCANYEVDAIDLTRPSAGFKVLAKPPTQAALFTEGAAPGPDGLIAVRVVGTGAWYWLNASAAVLNPFPLSPGPEDGPIAISGDGTLAAISLPDQGPIIEPINVATPVASASPVTSGTAPPAAAPTHSSPVPSAAPRHVNSKLPHADALAWSPDAKQLALAVNGEIEIYAANGPHGAAPDGR